MKINMKKAEMRRIMNNAHRKARQMEGDYQARMSLALKEVYVELKKVNTFEIQEIRSNEWAKGGYHRVYTEGEAVFYKEVNGNVIGSGFKFKGYYNVKENKFKIMNAPARYEDFAKRLIIEKGKNFDYKMGDYAA